MLFYLASLTILGISALILAAIAIFASLRHQHPWQTRLVNLVGSGLAALGCAFGFAAAIGGPWSGEAQTEIFQLPWGLPIGSLSLRLDGLSRIFLLPVFGLGLVCTLTGAMNLRRTRSSEHNLGAHWFFYILLLLGMALVMGAQDAVLFLLSWEIMSLAPFFLIDFNDSESTVRDAAWIYLVAAHLGAVFLMAFFGLLWQVSGVTTLSPKIDSQALCLLSPGVSALLFILALLGFGAKAGLMPLHVWLPEAHPAAPSHVSALMSGAMINAGLYGLIRSLGLLAGPCTMGQILGRVIPEWWGWLLLGIGLSSALLGILKALDQNSLKRLLAYSSVENMGLMFLGVGVGLLGQSLGNAWLASLGFAGALLHMLNHAGFKGLLFLCAGEVLHATGTLDMAQLGGLQKRLPILGAFFALGATAIACLPPLSGFISEFVLAMSILDAATLPGVERQLGLLLALAVLALVSGLACVCYVRSYGLSFLGEPRSSFARHAHPQGWPMLWPLLLPAAACIFGGLCAPAFFKLAAFCAQNFTPMPENLLNSAGNALAQIQEDLDKISLLGASGFILAMLIFFGRKLLLRKRQVLYLETWGCGYQASDARIQYSSRSFVEPLGRIFGPLMGIREKGTAVQGFFPQAARLSLVAPDRVRELLFNPLFAAIERLCDFCKIIQHGKIHLYILYILATLVALLVWGLA